MRLDRREFVIAEGMKDVSGVVTFSEIQTRVRVITLPAALVPDLSAPASSPLTWSSPTPRGAPLRNGDFRRDVLDPAAARAGLVGLTPLQLRHTAASLTVSAGANVRPSIGCSATPPPR